MASKPHLLPHFDRRHTLARSSFTRSNRQGREDTVADAQQLISQLVRCTRFSATIRCSNASSRWPRHFLVVVLLMLCAETNVKSSYGARDFDGHGVSTQFGPLRVEVQRVIPFLTHARHRFPRGIARRSMMIALPPVYPTRLFAETAQLTYQMLGGGFYRERQKRTMYNGLHDREQFYGSSESAVTVGDIRANHIARACIRWASPDAGMAAGPRS